MQVWFTMLFLYHSPSFYFSHLFLFRQFSLYLRNSKRGQFSKHGRYLSFLISKTKPQAILSVIQCELLFELCLYAIDGICYFAESQSNLLQRIFATLCCHSFLSPPPKIIIVSHRILIVSRKQPKNKNFSYKVHNKFDI